jgi:hypothetical protein
MDCDDPRALGNFWASVLDGDVAFASDEFVAVKLDRLWLSAVRIDDYRPPTWPSGELPKEIHLDLAVEDLARGEAEILALGAVKATTQPAPDRFLVFLDPAGHPFCLSTMIPE